MPKVAATKMNKSSRNAYKSAPSQSVQVTSGDQQQNSAGPAYEVEAIVSHRMRNGCTEYLVKWKDMLESENSWEPRSHLSCRELLREYNRKWRELAKSFLN